MSNFINKLAIKVIKSEGYKEASKSLFSAYVLSFTGQESKLDRKEISKLISSAQIFYKSESEEIKKEGAIILSMLLDICTDDNQDLVPIANSIFSNAGDFPNIQLLTEKYPQLNFKYNFYSEAQMEFRQSLNTIEELDFPLTDYQRSLWHDLSSDKDVITAAPTSAGKTHIILSYLMKKITDSDGAFAAIIVPTRALISEVAGKIYQLAQESNNEIEICTVPKEGYFREKTFFVMTQERLHEVLQRGDVYFDYLFIDEAHNITDKSRGVLLHLTIEKMLEDSFPQVIVSMPSPSYQDSFTTIFKDIEFKKKLTQHSPVAKIVMSVVPKGKELIISRHNSSNVKHIKKGFTATHLADIVYKLGKGQSNIIYRNKTNYCEDLANEISKRIVGITRDPLLEEAADYVEKFVHNEFSLAENLRKGVAFHYGPLPSSIRIMVENLAKSDNIKFIACTSTLAEGVNLPAKNLFLKNPLQPIMNQPSERIENVKINNITGRAGRMLQHFSGNIFLIEPDSWTYKDYFNEDQEEEEKIPTYFKSLNEELDSVLLALKGSYAHNEKDQYRFYTIANKLIKEYSSHSLNNTLSATELTLDEKERESLVKYVKSAYDNLTVASFTLEANPTIGYIQQNKLFNFLSEQTHFDEWLLPHPRSVNLYDILLKVGNKLNEFGVYT